MNKPAIDTGMLSPYGLERRGEILEHMQRAGRWRRRRRVAARSGLTAAPLAAVIAAMIVNTLSQPPISPAAPVGAVASGGAALENRVAENGGGAIASPSPAPVLRLVRYEVVATSPGIVERWSATAGAGRGIAIIGDRELSRELDLAGLDPGVIRTGNRVIVAAADRFSRPTP